MTAIDNPLTREANPYILMSQRMIRTSSFRQIVMLDFQRPSIAAT